MSGSVLRGVSFIPQPAPSAFEDAVHASHYTRNLAHLLSRVVKYPYVVLTDMSVEPKHVTDARIGNLLRVPFPAQDEVCWGFTTMPEAVLFAANHADNVVHPPIKVG